MIFYGINIRVKGSLSLLFIFLNLLCNSQTFQNLVPNGSFESYSICPSFDSEIYQAVPWTGPIGNSTDYYNACSNVVNVPHYAGISSVYPYNLNAKHGQAYAGLFLYKQAEYREYLQVKLNDTLIQNVCYYMEFYATSYQATKYNSNNAAISLSNYSTTIIPNTHTLINFIPHVSAFGNPIIKDTINWQRIAGLYSANGNETYLTIGNFYDDANTDTVNMYPPGTTPYYVYPNSYIFVDAVSVFSINPTGNLPWKYRDTTILEGDSVYIGNTMGGSFNPQWFTIGGNYIATNAGIYVKPVATTSYVVNYTVCGTQRADTVEVKVVSDIGIREKLLKEMEFKIFPNPAKDEITLEYAKSSLNKFSEIKVVDVLGRMVISIPLDDNKQIIDVSSLNNGCYFIIFTTNDNISFYRKMIKN